MKWNSAASKLGVDRVRPNIPAAATLPVSESVNDGAEAGG